MTPPNHIDEAQLRSQFLGRLNRLRDSYESLSFLSEKGDLEAAAWVAERLLDRIGKLVADMQGIDEYYRAYFDVVLKTRLSLLSSDQQALEQLQRENPDALTREQEQRVDAVTGRIPHYLRALQRDIDALFPSAGFSILSIRKWFGAYRRALAGAAALVVVLVLCGFTWNHFQKLKYSLKGEYFADMSLQEPAETRMDRSLEFDWGYGAPFLGFRSDAFSARWSGYIHAPKAGDYDFVTDTDDGVILLIDGERLIEDWNSQALKRNTATVYLEPGFHKILLEYFENNAAAVMKLSWRMPGDLEPSPIPSRYFRSSEKYTPKR